MKTLRTLAIGALMMAGLTLGSRAQVQTAGSLYVDVDPSGSALGLLKSINNSGTAAGVFEPSSITNGTFTSNDWPVVINTGGGTKGIMFNGRSHLEHDTGPNGLPAIIPASLTGTNPTCSIEVWTINPTVSDEEQLVSWGRTGGTNGLMAFGYGAGGIAAGGAVNRNAGPNLVAPYHGLAGPNISWGSAHPKPGAWHHLVYTFDGANRMNRLYVDGAKVVEFSNTVDVITFAGTNISIATGRGNPNLNGQNNTARAALVIGRVRIHSGVLSDANVLNNYLFEVNSYSNSPAVLSSGPIHRYSFNIPTTADAVGLTVTDSVGTAHGLIQGFAGGNTASTDGSKLRLNGGAPNAASTPPYVDFPNGLLSGLSVSNAGTGKISIEGWAVINGGHIWSPILNFGTTSTGERTGPDVSTTGYQGRNYLNWSLNGTSRALMRFEIGVASTNNIPTNIVQPGVTYTADFLMDNKNKVPDSMKYFAITWDEATGNVEIYINGIQAHHFNALPWKFFNIADVNCWLGRSPWQGDNYIQADYDEYRVYDRILTPAEVASDYHYGPDIVLTNLSDLGALSSIGIQLQNNPNTWVGMSPQVKVVANYANDPGVDITETTGIAYSSTDTSRATVSSNGMLRLVGPGAVTITATFGAQSANLIITNSLPPTPSVIHRYSFTGAFDYTDSVGGATGTANGTSIADGSGNLLLDPSGQGYLTLPNTVIVGEDALSVETWVNVNTAANNSQLWAFGDQNLVSANGRYGIFTTTSPNLRTALFDTDPGFGHEQNAQRNGNLNGLTNQHIVGVYDPLLGKISLYLNANLVAQVGAFTPLTSSISNVLAQVGRSLYNADPYWNGSMNEFRIWHGALSQQQVAINNAAGPNSVVGSPGSLLNVATTLPFSNTVVTVNQQATFTANFTSVSGVNLFAYGEAGVTAVSDNTNVATVSASGTVRAIGQGTAHIVFAYAGSSATNTITVANPAPSLEHRYTFNAANANDSVGTAHGTAQGGATFAGNKVVLNAGTADYVSLPSGILSGFFATTIEAWVDFGTNISGSWLYGFGDQNGGVQGRFYTYFSPHINNTSRAGITASDPGNTGEQNVTDNISNLDNKTNVHLAVVIHPFLGFEALYINGQRRNINTNITTLLSSVSPNLAWIGRSLYDSGGVGAYPTNQPYMNASLDEFRVYQGVLSNSQIALDSATGPNTIVTNPGAITAVRLVVNSNMTYGADQLVSFVGDFASSSVSNVNLFGYTNATLATSDTNVITTNALLGSIHASGTGQATITATVAGAFTNTATIKVGAANGPFIALRHRYSFNGDANDSVGTAHGTLMGSATAPSGALVLPGGANNNASAFLKLPGGVISSMTNLTVEAWARKNANVAWQRIFDFGNSDSTDTNQHAGAGVTYAFLTTDVGGGANTRFAFTTNGNNAPGENPQLSGPVINTGVTNHYVVVYDYSNSLSALYLNGASIATGVTLPERPLSTLIDTNNWLGRSQWAGDGNFNGDISEFRIYEGALNEREIAASSAAGPDAAPPIPSLTVATNGAGQLTISWPSFALRYALQGRADLTSGSWTNVTPFAPVTTNNVRRVTVAPSGTSQYFRLTD